MAGNRSAVVPMSRLAYDSTIRSHSLLITSAWSLRHATRKFSSSEITSASGVESDFGRRSGSFTPSICLDCEHDQYKDWLNQYSRRGDKCSSCSVHALFAHGECSLASSSAISMLNISYPPTSQLPSTNLHALRGLKKPSVDLVEELKHRVNRALP